MSDNRWLEEKAITLGVVSAHIHDLGHTAKPINSRDMCHDMNGQRDGLANAAMRQTYVRGKNAVREARERLLSRVRVNRAQATEMTGVQGLEEVECFGAAHFANENAIRAMTQRRTQEIVRRMIVVMVLSL